jgi:urea transport system permease protein
LGKSVAEVEAQSSVRLKARNVFGLWYVNLIVIALLVLFPWLMNTFEIQLMGKILIYGILALSLDLLWGYTGLLSFGHSALFAVGAYGMGLALKNIDGPSATYIGLVAAILLPSLLAVLVGYLIFWGRITGVYFGIITLALAAVLTLLFNGLADITGGSNGLFGLHSPTVFLPVLGSIDLTSDPKIGFYLALAGAIIAYVIARKLVGSPFGRAMEGVKGSELRMEALGYDVAKIKLMVFTISAALSGFAGALWIPVGGYISPVLLGLVLSTNIIIWVAVGGRGTLIGAFIGAAILTYLESFLSSAIVEWWLLVEGAFLVIVVLFWPQGIMGFIRERFGKSFIG